MRGALRALLLVVVLALPSVATAQPAGRVPRIGIIAENSSAERFVQAFREGLRQLGYTEGRTIEIEYRQANATLERVSELSTELVARKCEVLVVGGTASARAARTVTDTVPIVFTSVGDPVGVGLVASLARPGGNVTGVSNLTSDLNSKQLELLKASVPSLSRVAVLYNPANTSAAGPGLDSIRAAARTLGLELRLFEVRQRNELAGLLPGIVSERAGAVLATSDPVVGFELAELARLTTHHRLPAIYSRREFAELGGLLSYGPSFADNYRRAAMFVDKILKGARPAELPVERPTRFELVANLGAARRLGLTLPPTVLERADEVLR